MIILNNRANGIKFWTFPAGERNVSIDPKSVLNHNNFIHLKFQSSNDLIDMLLVVNALRNMGTKEIKLVIPYFPFARQDRVMSDGEPFALQVAVQLIKSCNFKEIVTSDPHSDVLAGMFEPGQLQIISQDYLAYNQLQWNTDAIIGSAALVSPDAGALKKIYKLASRLDMPVIEASKKRDVKTGEITSTAIDTIESSKYDTLIVVDDICDGGRTFIELAKVIKTSTNRLVLVVTHAIFSKGIEALEEWYDVVLYSNDMRSI